MFRREYLSLSDSPPHMDPLPRPGTHLSGFLSNCPPSPPVLCLLPDGGPARCQQPSSPEGDSISMQGEIAHVHDNGTVTVRLHGFDYPLTVRAEHPDPGREAAEPEWDGRKPLFDEY